MTRTHDDTTERLARIESRLVQTMLFLGASPYEKNPEGGVRDVIMEAVRQYDLDSSGHDPIN